MAAMLTVVKYFPVATSTVKIMGDGPKNEKGEIISSILRINPTPFGSPVKKDLHDQYFTEATYFGDDFVTEKFGVYEHFMNGLNNSEAKKFPAKTNILGTARLVKEEGDPTRWFDIEIARSHAYHDFVFKMADMGILGASTQAFQNSVEVEDDGFIPVWPENEVGPTVSPANPDSLRMLKALKLQKSFISLPPMTVKMWKNEELVDIIVDPKKDEPIVTPEPTPEPETPLSEQIDALLNEAEDAAEEASTEIDLSGVADREQVEALKAELAEMKSNYKDLAAKLDQIVTGMGDTQKSVFALAHFVKNVKMSDAAKQYNEMSERERGIREEAEKDKKKPLKAAGTVAPYGAPGTN